MAYMTLYADSRHALYEDRMNQVDSLSDTREIYDNALLALVLGILSLIMLPILLLSFSLFLAVEVAIVAIIAQIFGVKTREAYDAPMAGGYMLVNYKNKYVSRSIATAGFVLGAVTCSCLWILHFIAHFIRNNEPFAKLDTLLIGGVFVIIVAIAVTIVEAYQFYSKSNLMRENKLQTTMTNPQ